MMRRRLREFLLRIARILSRRVRDERTGEDLGRVLVLSPVFGSWFIGELRRYVRPVFRADRKIFYWWANLGFATWPECDFPRLPCRNPPPSRGKIAWVLLVHNPPEIVAGILDYWEKQGISPEAILVVHGGAEADFREMVAPRKVYVGDPLLRTRNHPLEKQSYRAVFACACEALSREEFDFVCFAEYDHLPLVPDWGERMLRLREEKDADVLFHHLMRVDGTNAPHYRHHLSDPSFASGPWRRISRRDDPLMVLNALPSGSLWSRAAFEHVANSKLECPVYLEMDLPSSAHHLGFRVMDFGPQNAFVHVGRQPAEGMDAMRAAGAWSLHPVKNLLTATK